MAPSKAKLAGLATLLLAGGGGATRASPLSNFKSNYSRALTLGTQNAQNAQRRIQALVPGGYYTQEREMKIRQLLNTRALNASVYQQARVKEVSSLWTKDGIMPQEIFDAVISQQVPTLGEWDVFAHGALIDQSHGFRDFVIPPETVVVFWNLPGTPTTVSRRGFTAYGVNPIPKRNVTSKSKTGNATARDGAYSVMHVQGDVIPDVQLQFKDDTGLPIGVFHSETGRIDKEKKHTESLSKFLQENGPGVYYVLSCRSFIGGYDNNKRRNIQDLVQYTERARERQRKYSDPITFDNYSGKSQIRDIGKYRWTNQKIGMALSGYRENAPFVSVSDPHFRAYIFAECLKMMLPYMLNRATTCFVKGAYVDELITLLKYAQPVSFTKGASLSSSSLRVFATARAFQVIKALGKRIFMRHRKAGYTKRIQKLRKQFAASSKNKNKALLNEAMKLRKYGFDTPDALRLVRLYELHKKRLTRAVNIRGLKEMESAYAMAREKIKRESIVSSMFRSLFSGRTANARRAQGGSIQHKKAMRLIKSWGFKPGMTLNAINQRYSKVKTSYSLMNRLQGRVPRELTLAYTIAKKYTSDNSI